jgi:acetyltransferase/esterase
MSYFEVPGARLYYETRGAGPLLLLIPGANGDANAFPPLANRLAADFTVVTYDRRGYTRSLLDGAQDYPHRLETDANDARRLIEHLADEPATVFGTSSGAVIALQLLIDHPQAVRAVVAFEPAAMKLIPDGERWITFLNEIYALYRQSGPAPARALFVKRCFAEVDHPIMSRTPAPEHAATAIANANYFFEREVRQYTAVELDMEKLSQRAEMIIPAVGLASNDFPDGQIARALSVRLGRGLLELPDGHVGYATSSEEFASRLLRRLKEEAAISGQHAVDHTSMGQKRTPLDPEKDDRANGKKNAGGANTVPPSNGPSLSADKGA